MIWFILFGIIGIYYGYRLFTNDFDDSWGAKTTGIFIGIVSSFLVSLIMNGIIFGLVLLFSNRQQVEYWNVDIVSLKNSESISGSFFLGCGSIDGVEMYSTFYRTGKDSYKSYKANVNISSIHEGFDKPKLIAKGPESLGIPKWLCIAEDENIKSFEFQVPKGTIIQEFKVN